MKIRVALVSALVVGTLSACSSTPNIAGSAFVVGDERVAQSEVTTLVREASAQLRSYPPSVTTNKPTTAQLSSTIVSRLLQHEIFMLVEQSDERFKVTPLQIKRTRDILETQYGSDVVEQQLVLTNGTPKSQINNFVHDITLSQVVSKVLVPNGSDTERQTAFSAYIKKLTTEAGVRISPRYGVWNQDEGKLVPTDATTSVDLPSPPAEQ